MPSSRIGICFETVQMKDGSSSIGVEEAEDVEDDGTLSILGVTS